MRHHPRAGDRADAADGFLVQGTLRRGGGGDPFQAQRRGALRRVAADPPGRGPGGDRRTQRGVFAGGEAGPDRGGRGARKHLPQRPAPAVRYPGRGGKPLRPGGRHHDPGQRDPQHPQLCPGTPGGLYPAGNAPAGQRPAAARGGNRGHAEGAGVREPHGAEQCSALRPEGLRGAGGTGYPALCPAAAAAMWSSARTATSA